MLVSFISWICIGVSSFLWGLPFLQLFSIKKQHSARYCTFSVITGLSMLTVFSEIVSLFFKVGVFALITVFIVDIILFVLYYKRILSIFCLPLKNFLFPLFVGLLSGFFILRISSGYIYNSDTYLYHAQSIRWIEEYGVIKGLGNIHSRLAFNSSFLCLQALFSFKGICSHSLHSVNGFVAWLFFVYSICSLKMYKEHRFWTSDFIRVCMVVLLSLNTEEFSSPGTDFFSHTLSVFLLCEYISYLEDHERSFKPYALLSILSLYCITLKLSSGILVLLAMKPAVILIRERKWKETLLCIFCGAFVLIPWMLRNIMLSGYLIYPFEALDFFSFDWKMPSSVVAYERNRTAAWAKEIFGIYNLDTPFSTWFPVWLKKQSPDLIIYLVVSCISCLILIAIGIRQLTVHKNVTVIYISLIVTACFVFWFVSAPHIRFGRPYTLLPPFLLLGVILSRFSFHQYAVTAVILLLLFKPVFGIINRSFQEPFYPIYCSDYEPCDVRTTDFYGTTFYIPENNLSGYYSFPSTLSEDTLDKLELRGDNLTDGIRPILK